MRRRQALNDTLREFPALVIGVMIAALLMLVPALFAARDGDWVVARTFLYHSVFFLILGAILGLALMNRRPRIVARYYLGTLLLAYVLLPVVLAFPMAQLVPALGFRGAYFEMLSALTTTGATLIAEPFALPEALHLWRALVGWSGGFMILVMAVAILAPLNLGGFEIIEPDYRLPQGHRAASLGEVKARLRRASRTIGPVYASCTAVLALLLIFAGDRPFVAVCHAMSTLATSGISPVGGIGGAQSGMLGEMAIALLLLPAVSHRLLMVNLRRFRPPRLTDPQVQLMLISVLSITVLLFLRNFIGAAEEDRQGEALAALQAIWGSLFTVLSFLTTAGFESRYWADTQAWSGLEAPGITLLAVAVMGGGIATTAGGIKLLRLYALYRHGLRELNQLVHPSSLGRLGGPENLVSEHGARIAFIFLMLFLITLALVMIALSATGLDFQGSLALAVAALTTTGPAIETLGAGISYAAISEPARFIAGVAMIIGRMEALVIIALLNPEFWRQ
jgi:trk system potassium uptake protein